MFVKIDFVSDIPIYQQIKDQVIEGIASGNLTGGESLPSVRQFAEDLGVNMHTVNKAYSMLKNEGFVVVHKRQGVVVNSLENMRDPGFLSDLQVRLRPHSLDEEDLRGHYHQHGQVIQLLSCSQPHAMLNTAQRCGS